MALATQSSESNLHSLAAAVDDHTARGYHPLPMELTGTIGSLIGKKGGQVWSLLPTASVYDAIAMMAEKQVGALPVVEAGNLLGIVSERDYARKVILNGRSSKETAVTEIMSSPVISVTPTHTIGECMRIVTERRIRHLPVTERGRLVGMVSIGDLVNWVISEQQETIHHLEAYIAGTPAF
jgi:signal-transduction protein with cAMP-binding, CBS, and nucleotidyltransferase domain